MSEELPKTGDLIGVRYRIETLLGKGGMGAVFSAVNQATGRAVAIKWMLPGAARSKEALARFLSEARATAKIEHPNVIQILDVGQDGDAPFLVMERLRGQSLADRLEKGRLSVEEALDVIIPSCRGLAEAHSEGIIHRDVKPDNIFLCEGKDGSRRPAKVLDFGISKLFDQEGGPAMTQTGIAMGTPWYMSPEQLNAPPDADARFDVYAMGVVLYECLTGRPPYNADGLFELVQQIAAGNPTPIRFLSPDVPPDLEAVAMRAMHANRDVRYANMQELIAQLEGVQGRIRAGGPAPQHSPIPPTGAMYNPTPTPGYGGGAPSTGPMGGGQWTPASGYGGPPTGPTPTGAAYAPTYGVPQMAPPRGGGNGGKIAVVGGLAVVGLGLLCVVFGGVGWMMTRGDDGGSSSGDGGGASVGGVNLGGLVPDAPATNPRDPNIAVTFTGDCTPRWDARRMVTGSGGTVNVISSGIGGMTGSVMLTLPAAAQGTITLSTQHRMDTQIGINVMTGQRIWTNMAIDVVPVTQRRIPDPISGSITVNEWDSDLARMDVTFHNVTLQNMQDGSMCNLDGRLQTFGTTYGG